MSSGITSWRYDMKSWNILYIQVYKILFSAQGMPIKYVAIYISYQVLVIA
jgi:hypothetical protein